MPITVTEIAANTATIMFYWGDNEVNIVYRPGLVTEKIIAQMLALANMDEDSILTQMQAFNKSLARLISRWDVLEADGSMYPLEPDKLADLSFMFRARVIQAILGDIRPEALTPQTGN